MTPASMTPRSVITSYSIHYTKLYEALQQLAAVRPDVVVTDIKMPDVDGLTLLKKIGELDPTVSVVIMTGYGTIDMAVQALKDGAYDFLEKPFEKNHVITSYSIHYTKLYEVISVSRNPAISSVLPISI